MSKKRAKKADWAADVEVRVDASDRIVRPEQQSEANDQKSPRANSADSDGSSVRGDAEGKISDAEWMRRKMGGVELYEQVFEQSDDDHGELTKPKTTQVYPLHTFQYNHSYIEALLGTICGNAKRKHHL